MFKVSHTPIDTRGVIVVTLTGSADMIAADAMERAMRPIAAARPRTVIIDLAQLTFICSLALGSLVSVRNAVASAGGRCVVAGSSADVASVLHRCHLEAIFTMKPTLEEAMKEAGEG